MVHDDYQRRILDEVASGAPVTQRRLSRELGIALGLTNLLLKRLVRKGFIRLVNIKSNRVRYLLTPKGIAEKARMSQRYFAHSVKFYSETRDQIRKRLNALEPPDSSSGTPRLVFAGSGEEAEIGYVCLQGTRLNLVGVLDMVDGRRFFGTPIHPVGQLSGCSLAGEPFDWIVVMSFGEEHVWRGLLRQRGVPADRIVWLS